MADSKETGKAPIAGELERLRNLIFGEEKSRLHNLDRRVSDLESRTADVAEVLPGAMNRLVENPVTKPELEQPIVDTIRGAIKRDTESFAEALFPVLGPAIRRAVADALKSLVQRINVAMEHSFTVKGLRWRMEAARTGVPFAQVVLRHTMVYAVQEAFLIQRKSGLVLCSVQRDEALALDEDAVSAMLTAIQAFIQDSLGLANDEPLRSAELGDRTLWVINGPDAVLACIITGEPPREVRIHLMRILESLHAQFGDRFEDHPEQVSGDPGITAIMQEALREEADTAIGGPAGAKYRLLWGALGLALLALLGWSAWNSYRDGRLEQEITRLFAAQPGYLLTSVDADRGSVTLAGLRDPLAADAHELLSRLQVDPADISQAFRPYQSLEPEMVIRRLSTALGATDSIALDLDGERLIVSGQLTPGQFTFLERLPVTHPIIRTVNLEQARLSADAARSLVRETLQAPDSVLIQAVQGRMQLGGTASAEWFQGVVNGPDQIGGWSLDFSPLRASLARRADTLAAEVDGQVLRFSRGSRMADESRVSLASLAAQLRELQQLAGVLETAPGIRLEGHTDGVGDAEKNRQVALDRAQTIRSELVAHGVDGSQLDLGYSLGSGSSVDLSRRMVVIHVDGMSAP